MSYIDDQLGFETVYNFSEEIDTFLHKENFSYDNIFAIFERTFHRVDKNIEISVVVYRSSIHCKVFKKSVDKKKVETKVNYDVCDFESFKDAYGKIIEFIKNDVLTRSY